MVAKILVMGQGIPNTFRRRAISEKLHTTNTTPHKDFKHLSWAKARVKRVGG